MKIDHVCEGDELDYMLSLKPIKKVKEKKATIIILIGLALGAGLFFTRKTEPLPEFEHWNDEPKYQLIMNMDKSCFDQFQNNQDKALYLKLYFEK